MASFMIWKPAQLLIFLFNMIELYLHEYLYSLIAIAEVELIENKAPMKEVVAQLGETLFQFN